MKHYIAYVRNEDISFVSIEAQTKDEAVDKLMNKLNDFENYRPIYKGITKTVKKLDETDIYLMSENGIDGI